MIDEVHAALVRGLQARNRLLLIHALIGIEVGLFIIFTGAPLMIEENFGPYARLLLGAQSTLPGILVLIGMAYGMSTRRGRWMAFFGILGLFVWQITMAIIFFIQALEHGVLLPIGAEMPPDAALSYVSWVYVNLAALMVVHLVEIAYSTFWRESAVSEIHLTRRPR